MSSRIASFCYLLCGFLTAFPVFSWAGYNITGTVKDKNTGAGIPGATVQLVRAGISTATASNGTFTLKGSAVSLLLRNSIKNRGPIFLLHDNSLVIKITCAQRVNVSVIDPQGKTVALLHERIAQPEALLLNSPRLGSGYFAYKVEIQSKQYILPFVGGDLSSRRSISASFHKSNLAKTAAYIDTIRVTKNEYLPQSIPLSDSIVSGLEILMQKAQMPPPGMVLIPAKNKTFMMGAKDGEGYGDEYPRHSVTLTRDFYMDITEVTQAQYRALMGVNPSSHKNDNYPVNNITWFDCILYCNKKSKAEGLDTVYTYTGGNNQPTNYSYPNMPSSFVKNQLTGLQIHYDRVGYRLPTEAEWEFACRGGSDDKYFFGGGNGPTYPTGSLLESVNQYAWHHGNSNNTPHAVKSKKPNPYGLYDITGNVWEYTNDWAINNGGAQGGYTAASAGTDPKGPLDGWFKVFRGGDWSYGSNACNCTFRSGGGTPDFRYIIPGFRTVLIVP